MSLSDQATLETTTKDFYGLCRVYLYYFSDTPSLATTTDFVKTSSQLWVLTSSVMMIPRLCESPSTEDPGKAVRGSNIERIWL
jgi:hypothetical protein